MKTQIIAALCFSFASIALAADLPEPKFRAVTIDDKIQIGYGVTTADVDGDGKPDVVLADKNQFVWYRNPTWEKFILAENLTKLDNVCIAARDIDGDGKAEIAVGGGWNPNDTTGSGAVFYLVAPKDRTQYIAYLRLKRDAAPLGVWHAQQAYFAWMLRNDPGAREVTGERDTPIGPTLYLARPIRALDRCLPCHSLPANAPATLVARYGSNNGFGWQSGEVVAAQIVSVPVAAASARASLVLRTLIISLIAMFLAIMLIINAALYMLVVRPVKQMAEVADQLSLGNTAVAEFSTRGGHEVAMLGVSLNRMHKSLDKALKMLER